MKKITVIASAIITIVFSVYLIIDRTVLLAYYSEYYAHKEINGFILTIIMSLLTVFVSLLVLFNIKLPKLLRTLFVTISAIIVIMAIIVSAISGYAFIITGNMRIVNFITFAFLPIAVIITMLIYIIRVLRPTNATLLITIGLACAVISATGIMWYNNSDNPTVVVARRQLHDKNPKVREHAIYELSRWRDKKSTPEIARLLKDINDDVRKAATETLSGFGAKDLIHSIATLLQDKNSKVRGAAVQALGELGAKESILEITKLLQDNNEWVRGVAVMALAKLGDKESIPHIKELLKDDEEWVRQVAQEALRTLDEHPKDKPADGK